MQTVDRLLEKTCYIIDFLPYQVPKACGGHFFEVENYLLNHYERYGIRERFIRIILKIMCYYPVCILWVKWIDQPSPGQVAEIIDAIMKNHSGDMNMVFDKKDALLQFSRDCLHLSIYNPDEEMRVLFEQIAISEGMFWRKSE